MVRMDSKKKLDEQGGGQKRTKVHWRPDISRRDDREDPQRYTVGTWCGGEGDDCSSALCIVRAWVSIATG